MVWFSRPGWNVIHLRLLEHVRPDAVVTGVLARQDRHAGRAAQRIGDEPVP